MVPRKIPKRPRYDDVAHLRRLVTDAQEALTELRVEYDAIERQLRQVRYRVVTVSNVLDNVVDVYNRLVVELDDHREGGR